MVLPLNCQTERKTVMNTTIKLQDLIEFAKEDMQLLKDNGYMAITDTKIGVINMSIDENGSITAAATTKGSFQEFDFSGLTEDQVVVWVASQYNVEA